jgi:hypothetical protein
LQFNTTQMRKCLYNVHEFIYLYELVGLHIV